MSQRIKVLIRPRALPKQQIRNYLSIDHHNNTISLQKHNQKLILSGLKDNAVRSFSFQKIFQEDVSQQQIYEQAAFSLVQNVLDGYNGTIFAYGQTGSGKTYTIMGAKQYMERRGIDKRAIKQENIENIAEKESSLYLNEVKGIIPRSFNQIITVINSRRDKKHLIQCSFIEIYNEAVHDLLAQDTKNKLSLKETPNKGLVIDGVNTFLVKSGQQLQKYLKIGYRNRSVRQTNMNKQSSRSHCIFNIKVQEQSTDQKGNLKFKVGKLNLVDLAGSERQNTHSNGAEGVKQTTKINLSLSALGKVINCLYNYKQNQKTHVPYRDSKLTRILQDSLGGNTKTIMIATISLSNSNYQQTLSTLIYASRAKFIQNKPIINEDPKDVLLREYSQQIQKLKSLLLQKQLQNEDLRKTTLKFKMNRTIRDEINTIDQIQQSKYIQDEQKNMLEQQGIKKKIYDLQQMFKKDEQNENEEQQKKELKKIEFLKMKIKLQQERQHELQKQKKIKQKQLQYIEKNYNNLNEEVDTLRNKFSNLKEKYSAKKQQLTQIKKEYDEQKEDLAHLLKQKDKQIQKLQKMLEGVIDNKSRKGNIKSNKSISQSDSQNSSRKIGSHFKIESKPKIKFNDSKLLKSLSTERKLGSNQKKKIDQSPPSKNTKHINYVQGKNYQSEHEKKVNPPNTQKKTQTLTNLMKSQSKYELDKQVLRKQSIKKVDSLISLKPLKRDSSLKLPFISEIKKMRTPKIKSQYNFGENQQTYFKDNLKEQMPLYVSSSSQNQKTEYASKISIDIAKIKQQIINELKNKGKQR